MEDAHIAAGQLGEESDLDSDREKRNKGRKRARKSVAKQQKPKINYLLEIPLDSFIEICSYARVGDVIHLSLVSKGLYYRLQGSWCHELWIILREANGLPRIEPASFSEYDSARLWFSKDCQSCGGKTRNVMVDVAFKKRWCTRCRKKNLIAIRKFDKLEYHSDTEKCLIITAYAPTLTYQDHDPRWYTPEPIQFAVREEARRISDQLYELRRQDLANQRKIASAYAGHPVHLYKSLVAEFIKSRKKKLYKTNKTSENLQHLLISKRRDVQKQQVKEAQEEKDKALAVFEEGELQNNWSQDEIELVEWKLNCFADNKTTTIDSEWPKFYLELKKVRDEHHASKAEEARLQAQCTRLQTFFPAFTNLQNSAQVKHKSVYPNFPPFLRFKAVLPMWEKAESVFDQGDWNVHLDEIKREVETYCQTRRMAAIKTILAATSDEELVDDPTAYTSELYPDSFFLPLKSFLFCHAPGCELEAWRKDYFFWTLFDLVAHQEICQGGQNYQKMEPVVFPGFDLPRMVSKTFNSILLSA